MRKFMPSEIVWSTGANPAILAATFGFCLLGTLMFALGPALKISRSAVITDLKENAGEDVMPTSLEIFTAQPARRCATRVLARPPDGSRFVRARREQSRAPSIAG
jgi:hypothetical protein